MIFQYGDEYASSYVMVHPSSPFSANGNAVTMKMKVKRSSGQSLAVFHSSGPGFSTWVRMDAQIQGDVATFSISEGGMFVVRSSSSNPGLIAGIVLTVLAVAVVVVVLVIYVRRNPDTVDDMRAKFRNAKRSFGETV